jgi:hypothetical protein
MLLDIKVLENLFLINKTKLKTPFKGMRSLVVARLRAPIGIVRLSCHVLREFLIAEIILILKGVVDWCPFRKGRPEW